MKIEGTKRRYGWLVLAAGILLGMGGGTALFFGFPTNVAEPTASVAAPPAQGSSTGAGSSTWLVSPSAELPELSVPTQLSAPIAGAPAPDFALRNLEGKIVSLSDLRGKVVVVNFWATWCEPCQIEMPILQSIYKAYQAAGLEVLAVDFDEPESDVRAYRDSLDLSFEILLDPGGKVQDLYRIRGYPTTFVIDQEGVMRAQQIGIVREGQLRAQLNALGIDGR